MAKDLNNIIEVTNGDFAAIDAALNSGKTVVAALQIGEIATVSLKAGKMNENFAKIELKEYKQNCGTCACGKPADALVYLWR